MMRLTLCALLVVFVSTSVEAQTKMRVRDPISRKFSPEDGFFERVPASTPSMLSARQQARGPVAHTPTRAPDSSIWRRPAPVASGQVLRIFR